MNHAQINPRGYQLTTGGGIRDGRATAFFVSPTDPDVSMACAYFQIYKEGQDLVVKGKDDSLDEETERLRLPQDQLGQVEAFCIRSAISAGRKIANDRKTHFYVSKKYAPFR